MELHLYSPTDPEDDLAWALETARAILRGKEGARAAYLPLGSLYAERLLATTQKAFTNVGGIEAVNTETMEPAQMGTILRRAALAYGLKCNRAVIELDAGLESIEQAKPVPAIME